jgi:hypothetical protein
VGFTQIIEVDGVGDEQALHEHVAAWDSEQAGIAPGYLGARVLADQATPGRYVIEVDFSSQEQAAENSERDVTGAWATELRELTGGAAPRYLDLRQVCTTYR